jgi:hypothetical protein
MSGYVPDPSPVLVTLYLDDDTYARAIIRGRSIEMTPPRVQKVVVQGSWEADRIIAAWGLARYHKGLPFGGSMMEAYKP